MALLSPDLAGVILPQDHFGSHLNSNGETVDEELEEQNFAHAGKILADIYGQLLLLMATQQLLKILIHRKEMNQKSLKKSFLVPKHVQELLDKSVLPARAVKNFPKGLPYDLVCRSLKKELQKCIYGTFGKYFASVKSMTSYIKKHCSSRSSHSVVSTPTERLRPQRLVAKRQREFMCVVKYLEKEEYEWHMEEELNTEGLEMPTEIRANKGTPIMTVQSREPVWQEDC
ncbi:hypothetical protein Hamer_G004515 [Homarus americanus]|uniref:Uncharacterized protein n=1 Tax=Homarus americanus TaxID=6706 RepID=A0A8J5JYG6_HOMAM|nr:hypothetical protein Hamer_G004515 [Homarus americanus]